MLNTLKLLNGGLKNMEAKSKKENKEESKVPKVRPQLPKGWRIEKFSDETDASK